MPRSVEEVRLRIECVREGVSSGEEGERRGDGGWGAREDWKGRRGLGRTICGVWEVIVLLRM